MTHRRPVPHILLAGAALLLGACDGALVDDPSTNMDDIVNGQVDPGHLSVGRVYQNGGGCTGTLIGPHTVLTAAHCLSNGAEAQFDDGSVVHNGVAIPHPSYGNGADFNFDIGIISLYTTSESPTTPVSVGPTFVGQPITMVGFGYTSANGGDYGTKRFAVNSISDVAGFDYTVPFSGGSAVCFGDSGGPDFHATGECQVGVHSRTAYPYCANLSFTTRVDVHVGWIQSVAPDGIATCTSDDQGPPPPPPGDGSLLDARVFDAGFYLDRWDDLRAAFGDDGGAAANHWLTYGVYEQRQANPAFDVADYLARYGDLQAAFGNDGAAATRHWLTYGINEGRTGSVVFDAPDYLARYGDLTDAFGAGNYAAALDHYLNNGIYEGRQASPSFDPVFYLAANPDVAAAYGDTNYWGAVLHYVKYGRFEGRAGVP